MAEGEWSLAAVLRRRRAGPLQGPQSRGPLRGRPHHANGKADYHRAQELAMEAVDATDG
jgi:hypothetical protein